MLIHLEDRKLVKRLLAGDEKAFNQFFDDHFSRLYRFALTRMPDEPESAREIVQSTLTKALNAIHKYRGESQLFTWLCAICRNELADWYRRTAGHRQHLVFIEDHPQIQAAVDSIEMSRQGNPDETLQRSEACRLIQVALDMLPPRYGDALEWKYIEGHSVREIAGRLGIGVEAAQSLLARAKRSFREVYGALTEHLNNTGKAQTT